MGCTVGAEVGKVAVAVDRAVAVAGKAAAEADKVAYCPALRCLALVAAGYPVPGLNCHQIQELHLYD